VRGGWWENLQIGRHVKKKNPKKSKKNLKDEIKGY
jgi:hypothetical protein